MDLIEDFAFRLPVTIICDMLGIPEEHRELFYTGSRNSGRILEPVPLSPDAAKNLINTVASVAETIVNIKNPSFSGELWVEFSEKFKLFRFQAFIPPVVEYPAFIIRKHAGKSIPIEEFLSDGIMTQDQAYRIMEAVKNKKSIVVGGGTQSGKTTLCNAILDYMSRVCPNDRIVIIEDTKELKCLVKNCLSLQRTPEKSINDLIYDAMRSRPDRIIIGEVRGKEGPFRDNSV